MFQFNLKIYFLDKMLNVIFILVLIAVIGFLVWKYIFNSPRIYKPKQVSEQPKKENNKNISIKEIRKFIPMSTWDGHKQNYVFKTGNMGTGYYLDKKVSFKNVEVQNYDPNTPPSEISK